MMQYTPVSPVLRSQKINKKYESVIHHQTAARDTEA